LIRKNILFEKKGLSEKKEWRGRDIENILKKIFGNELYLKLINI